jgi:hypothetical protein
MADNSVSRRLFLSAAAAAPAAPALLAADTSDRIAVFDPPPSRVRIAVAPLRRPNSRRHSNNRSSPKAGTLS